MPRKSKIVSVKTPPVISGSSEHYSVVLKIGEEQFEQKGSTIPEALAKFDIKDFAGKPSIIVKHGEQSYHHLGRPLLIKKIFLYPQHRILFEKRAKQFLGETTL